jgi:hypothetical protein
MTMVFCRGCGKEIHESAASCPHCGAPQGNAHHSSGKPGWMAILSIVIAGIALFGSLSFIDKDEMAGATLFGIISLILGIINLQQKRPGKGLSIAGISISSLALLILLGNAA